MGSTQTIKLATRGCPDPFCTIQKDILLYWNHTCGSEARLDRDGNIHCSKCEIKCSFLNARFICFESKNCYKPSYTRLLLILGLIGSISEKEYYNSSISLNLTYKEFTEFLDSVVDHLSNHENSGKVNMCLIQA